MSDDGRRFFIPLPKTKDTSGPDSSKSKSDLYAEAHNLDISGRSSMTKAELASALSEERGDR